MNTQITNHILDDKISDGDSPAQSVVWIEDDDGNKIVCKISKCADFVALHEDRIGKILTSQNHQNIVKYLGKRSTIININLEGEKRFRDSFLVGSSWHEDTTMWEYLDGVSMFEVIGNKSRFDDNIVISCVTQVAFALLELQKQVGFVHGDLNLNNIIVCKTDEASLKYVLDSKTVHVETFGYISKIVDFGNSHAWKFQTRLTTPMYGFADCKANLFFDEFMDFRFFLDNVSDELFKSRTCQMSTLFQRLSFNMLSNFDNIETDVDIYNEMDDDLFEAYEFVLRRKRQIKQSYDDNETNHDTKHTLDCLLSLVELPIDFSTTLSEAEIRDCDTLFDYEQSKVQDLQRSKCHKAADFRIQNENKILAFLNSWSDIKRFFTEAQARYVLREIVLFASKNSTETGSAIEGKFHALIHKLLKIFGQTMISIEMYKTTQVLLRLLRLSKPLKLHVTYFCQEYLENIFDKNMATVDMLDYTMSAERPKSVCEDNEQPVFATAIVTLFKMWKDYDAIVSSDAAPCSFFNPYNEFACIERQSVHLETCKKDERKGLNFTL